MAGYSQTPLLKKLGIKENQTLCVLQAPKNFWPNLGELPPLRIVQNLQPKLDYIHLFTSNSNELSTIFPQLKNSLTPNGSLWISWPKKSSQVPTDLDENIIRELGLQNGLVDVKVCAVDDIWSGLKFVFRLQDRSLR